VALQSPNEAIKRGPPTDALLAARSKASCASGKNVQRPERKGLRCIHGVCSVLRRVLLDPAP